MTEVKDIKKELHKENLAFRYLYALGVIFVVLSHCGADFLLPSNFFHFGSFHLAIFLFGSGYFWKDKCVEKPVKTLKKWTMKLILPLWLTNAIYGIVIILLHRVGFIFGEVNIKQFILGPIFNAELFSLNLGSWFVFPFLMVQILYFAGTFVIYKMMKGTSTKADNAKNDDHIQEILQQKRNYNVKLCKLVVAIWRILMLVAGLAGVYLSMQDPAKEQHLVIYRICYFAPFFILGLWYRDYLKALMKKVPKYVWMALCLLISMGLQTYYGRQVFVIPSSCDYPFGILPSYTAAIIGVVFWMMICYYLSDGKVKWKGLSYIGKHTWEVMVHQFAGIFLLNCIFAMLHSFLGLFADFDMTAFHGTVWYIYLPGQLEIYKLLYVVYAIGFSMLIAYVTGRIKEVVKNGRKNKSDL